jgi:hypothetical protein
MKQTAKTTSFTQHITTSVPLSNEPVLPPGHQLLKALEDTVSYTEQQVIQLMSRLEPVLACHIPSDEKCESICSVKYSPYLACIDEQMRRLQNANMRLAALLPRLEI